MDKKYIAIIIVLIIIVAGIGVVAYNSTNNAKVGSSQVAIPNGYYVTNTTNHTAVLKSDTTTIIVDEKIENDTIDQIFDSYKKEHEEFTVKESSEDLGNNITLRSITLRNSTDNKFIHTNYYYQKDNKVYHIFMKGKKDKTALEKIVNTTQKQTIPII